VGRVGAWCTIYGTTLQLCGIKHRYATIAGWGSFRLALPNAERLHSGHSMGRARPHIDNLWLALICDWL